MIDNNVNKHVLGVTRCGDSLFRWGTRTYIMGIINLSPDSFSGDGYVSVEAALQKACVMVEEGADMIDVGGESTRPNAAPVSVNEEAGRVIPFIRQACRLIKVPISVDTYKYEVATQALAAGASMINDISGLKMQPEIVKLAADKHIPVVLTSNERGRSVINIVESVIGQLRELVLMAKRAGVEQQDIIVDPGIGFGKSQAQNLEILRRLDELKVLQRPILLGTSRKSFITNVLNLSAEGRLYGTAASVATGIIKGADIVRVHDVKQMSLISRMTDTIVRSSVAE